MKLLYGQRVKVGNKEGIVREAGDKYKIKFDDGSCGFFLLNEVTPIVEESKLKGKYDRMKAEGKLNDSVTFMEPTATETDPLSQPEHDTGRGIGE